MIKKWTFYFLVCMSLVFSGCGLVDYYFLPTPQDTPQELAQAGYDALSNKNYEQAIEFFSKLKDRYPFSPYTPKAEIGLGDAYFLNQEYKAAAEVYKEFVDLHPRDEAVPYALFKIGVAEYLQFDSLDKPYDILDDALSFFKRVLAEYPESKYAFLSKQYIVKCRRLMAEHEIFVADFYFKRGEYLAAWKRYEYVQKHFAKLPQVRGYAQKKAKLAYFYYLKKHGEKERKKEQGSWKDWFDWL